MSLLSTTDVDIERQFRMAEKKLKNEGVGHAYGKLRSDLEPIEYKIDVILYANSVDCMGNLMKYAETKYHRLVDESRSELLRKKDITDQQRTKYKNIINDGDAVSYTEFRLPQTIQRYPTSADAPVYKKHLYVDEVTGGIRIKLNGWESGLLKEEENDKDFVCWLRNPDRRSWSLCIPYEKDGYNASMYPDFIVVRKRAANDYDVDILEPHDPSRTDNLGKAKGLAKYAKNYAFGRVQLIRKVTMPTGGQGFKRLEMSRSEVQARVKHISTNEELDHLFDELGFYAGSEKAYR